MKGRIPFLTTQLQRFEQPTTVVIEEFAPALGTVAVKNRGTTPVELGGLSLTTNIREPRQALLPGGTLAPGESRSFTSAELGLTFANKGELGLFGAGNLVDFRDLLFYGESPGGTRYLRAPDGAWQMN